MTLPGRIHVPSALPARALLVCAASFFNSKDLPFLGMFMIALCLTHRAFRKDTVGAFLLCGVGVGILVNLRIMGIVTFPAILAMRGLDLALCTERTSRHILATMGAFAVAAPCSLYAISPYLWADPFEFFTAVRTLAHHPTVSREMFQGSVVRASELPPHFLPTWIAISTPPMELLFGVTGAVAVCVLCVLRPRQALGEHRSALRVAASRLSGAAGPGSRGAAIAPLRQLAPDVLSSCAALPARRVRPALGRQPHQAPGRGPGSGGNRPGSDRRGDGSDPSSSKRLLQFSGGSDHPGAAPHRV